jgi:hypothetical protein
MPLDGDQHPSLAQLRQTRDLTLDRLSEGFARDELSLEDFESRVDRAYAARAEGELRGLVADLAEPQEAALARAPEVLLASPRVADGERLALAVFGNIERRIGGRLGARTRVLSVFGNVELDLRELRLPPGVTELHVRAVFGNIELTVPPSIAVECQGSPIFGSFATLDRVPHDSSGQAVLRIVGHAVFGNVEVRTLPPRAILTSYAHVSRALPPDGGTGSDR